uniref:Uncharacterized protein n=1 Tax=Pristionchus pacificus TaxID=54126 RepID=A0A2A6BTW1_PRIPA|eukprot:PDM69340.1 hypothetical protein PRIPAC_47642 [Pristionchus pacificus]
MAAIKYGQTMLQEGEAARLSLRSEGQQQQIARDLLQVGLRLLQLQLHEYLMHRASRAIGTKSDERF